jgi:hypothetical protein
MENPSEELQMELVRNPQVYYNYNSYLIERYIKSEKAWKLYYKLKKVRGVIK